MSYYKNGLDWKPKSISRDGSEVPKNQNAQYVLPRVSSESTSASVQNVKEEQRIKEQFKKRENEKAIEKAIANQPQFKQGKKEISNTTNNSDGRSFLETASQFIPIYEQGLDIKDIVQGAITGDTEMRNRGIVGMAAPVSGKAVMGTLDYLTEKVFGKNQADYNEDKRKSIINSPTFNRALFEKYGWGGYDKWIKDGKPPLYKKGGVIKDNNGYWNPDNWGKVVEINSPDITMENVYEPLIGESKQTGEKKIMLPGKNYKFANTKQVIERPIGKNGVNQQDEKVDEQLDQLTNFTNYNKPTKGGWLDKYN
jgi:hypothetical protein